MNFQETFSLLSERELQVIYLKLTGFTSSEIALLLGITQNTIRNHTKSIYTKYDVSSLAELLYKQILCNIPMVNDFGKECEKYYYKK